MPCYHPLRGYRGEAGGVRFTPAHGYIRPVDLPCGQCIGCRLERSRQWAVRCVHESQGVESCFLTLTYAPEHLPPGGTLVPRHLQLFLKRVRRRFEPARVRFFACGEYGELLARPHYHAILFGVDFADKVFWKKAQSGESIFTSASLGELWGLGFTATGAVSFESAAYVARYCTKKVSGEGAVAHYRRVDEATGEVFDLAPEFLRMSLKPGIGFTWLREFFSDVYPSDEVVVRGKSTRPPRYYDKVLEEGDLELLQRLKLSRRVSADRHFEDGSPRRLRDAEKVKQAQVGFLKRSLEGQ